MKGTYRAALSAALLIVATCPMGAAVATTYTSANLIVGGDGEAAACSPDWNAVTTVPGWTVLHGNPSVVCYTAASFSTPNAQAQGKAFLADGPYGDSTLQQRVDVSAASTAIDTGTTTYTLSGWLGGYGIYSAHTVLSATFLDANGQPIGASAAVPTVTASDRGYKNAFLQRAISNAVPVGTRSISVLLRFVDTSASYNIGYADNVSLTLSTPVPAPALTSPASNVPAYDHVFIVMMENTTYSQVIGDTTDAPFINSLAQRGTLLMNSSGTYHPSDENYLAIAGGDNFVQGAIYYPNIHVAAPHLGDRLEAMGKTWKAYEQGMGTPCNTNKNYDSYYAPDDAPFINFTNISNDAARCQAHLVDLSQLTSDLQTAATTPNFAWLAADDYYDGEASGNGSSASLKVQDGWLQQTLQPILNSPAWTGQRSLLILTWDESADKSNSSGNHIATILVDSRGAVRAGYGSSVSYNHFHVGRTIEQALGLASLTANDTYAAPINDAFAPAAPPPPAPTLSTTTVTVPQGGRIVFDYATTGAKQSTTNWVGIYNAGNTPGSQSSITWQYVPTANGNVAFDTSALSPGNYTAWYLYNDGYGVLNGPVSFTVSL
ncbi:Phosphoesterase family protein [Dyella sp. OK004]|uniref:alkaline phosphatase family protein n=1 Tax=Dyella sp. OK004 TaxID=1855292 RepID=UPI0008EF2216|nr:alkaline phosphatase family protein [Dyella sp. OK004]SFS00658.1 Phosphoesterase family protein [Dyella sp. OK004]